jgi:hypothetical protein
VPVFKTDPTTGEFVKDARGNFVYDESPREKANEFFADGVMDEILTNLSRVVDLKVTSRTSVMLSNQAEGTLSAECYSGEPGRAVTCFRPCRVNSLSA